MPHWILSAAIGAAIMISSSGSASPSHGVVSGIYDGDPESSETAFDAEAGGCSVSVPSIHRSVVALP
jgi:hypothetical protein